MEVASPHNQDPISLMNDSDANTDNSSGEQMDVAESTGDSGKPDEIEGGVRNEAKDNSKHAEEMDESTKQAELEGHITNHKEGMKMITLQWRKKVKVQKDQTILKVLRAEITSKKILKARMKKDHLKRERLLKLKVVALVKLQIR
jgi:hypothetical protein